MKEEKIKNAIKAGIAITIIATIIIFVITIILQYNEEGEKNMPFELSKITIVSTAEGMEANKNQDSEGTEEKTSTWQFDVLQNNDIYFTISKNDSYEKEEVIKNVKIDNIQILKKPNVGTIKTYMPNSLEGRRFKYSDEYLVEGELNYKGASKSDEKNLEIGNQGGNFSFSFCNTELGTYESNEETEIKHDASLIEKMGKSEEDLKFKVSFDICIELEKKKYKTTIELNLPCENLISQGKSTRIIEDTSQFIFKRAN